MRAQQRRNTNIGVGIGVLVQVVGLVLLNQQDPATVVLGMALFVASFPPLIWGCMNYADGKGHSRWLGLLGLAGIVGLVVLILLPDQHEPASVDRRQFHKIAGLISLVAGFGFVLLGLWLHDLGEDVRLERMLGLWPMVSALFGVCLVAGALVLIVGRARQ